MNWTSKEIRKIKSVISASNVYFFFRKLKSEHGLCYRTPTEDGNIYIIVLDPQKEFFSTLLHEAFHVIYPESKEREIRKFERNLVKSLSQRQILDILEFFVVNSQFLTKNKMEDILDEAKNKNKNPW